MASLKSKAVGLNRVLQWEVTACPGPGSHMLWAHCCTCPGHVSQPCVSPGYSLYPGKFILMGPAVFLLLPCLTSSLPPRHSSALNPPHPSLISL